MINEKDNIIMKNTENKIDYLNELNSRLEFKIIEFNQESNDNIILKIQVGESKTEDDNIQHWVKCLFRSGKTYLYTDSYYVDYVVNHHNRIEDQDIEKKIDKSRRVEEHVDETEGKLKRPKKIIKTRFYPIFLDQTPINDDDKFKYKLRQIFNDFYEFCRDLVIDQPPPVPVETTFNQMFKQEYDEDLNPIENDTDDTNYKTVLQIKTDGSMRVLYDTNDIVNSSGFNIWKQGIQSISWCGKLITKTPTTIEEVESKDFSLSGLEEIHIPIDED